MPFNLFQALGRSDGFASAGHSGYGRLADPKRLRHGHGRHA
jgi:hypothetical protein